MNTHHTIKDKLYSGYMYIGGDMEVPVWLHYTGGDMEVPVWLHYTGGDMEEH